MPSCLCSNRSSIIHNLEPCGQIISNYKVSVSLAIEWGSYLLNVEVLRFYTIIHIKCLAPHLAIARNSTNVSCYDKYSDSNEHVARVWEVLDQISSNPEGMQ